MTTTDDNFGIILSKNRIARELKGLYAELNRSVPEYILFDFDEIEKKTGNLNQPSGRDILTSKLNV